MTVASQARPLSIGTRGSRLALIQAGLVADALARAGRPSDIVTIESDGDRRAPDTAWGEGAFVVALERALAAGDIDVAVHSAKDVPVEGREGLIIGAYLPRADPRDALVVHVDSPVRSLRDLPPGARVGTDSPRRTAFLLSGRSDLAVHPLHGNVDTRLRRLDAGETDALVLACAGLDRLGFGHRIVERLDPATMPPAPGQGAIAVQIRRDDPATTDDVGRIDDVDTRVAVELERAILRDCGGGCRSPIGVLAVVDGDHIAVMGGASAPDGSSASMARRRGARTAAAELAWAVAADLVGPPGARPESSDGPPRVIVTRASDQSATLLSALRDLGVEPVSVPAIAVEIVPAGGPLDAAARRLSVYDWTIVTSVNGVRAVLRAAERVLTPLDATRWAAVGPATAAALERDGILVDFVPDDRSGQGLGASLPTCDGQRVLVVRGDLADDALPTMLRDRGAIVDVVVGYRTHEAPAGSRDLLDDAISGGRVDAVLFTSGSTVRGLVALADGLHIDATRLPAVCLGPRTAAEARAAGFRVIAVSPTTEDRTLAAVAVQAVGAGRSGR